LLADRDRPDAVELREQAHALRVRIEETRRAFEDLDVPVADTRATLARLTARLAEVEAARASALTDLRTAGWWAA
jgi:hypothetical protein